MREVGPLINGDTGAVVASSVLVADGYFSRLVGLLGRSTLGGSQAILLVPCRSIHTMFMRFPIDVVYLDGAGQVRGVDRHVRAWRVRRAPRHTRAVLEMAAGHIDAQRGDGLVLEEGSGRVAGKVPGSVSFLTSAREGPNPVPGS